MSIGDLFYCKLANNLLRNIKINKIKYYFKLQNFNIAMVEGIKY